MAVQGYLTYFTATTADGLVTAIIAAMVASGKWTDAGDSTGDVLYGTADSQGRKPYIKVHKRTSGTDFVFLRVGTGSDGSGNITGPGGWTYQYLEHAIVPTNGWAWGYQFICTDRWVYVRAPERGTEHAFGGFYEVESGLESGGADSDLAFPVISFGVYDTAFAGSVVDLDGYSASNIETIVNDVKFDVTSLWWKAAWSTSEVAPRGPAATPAPSYTCQGMLRSYVIATYDTSGSRTGLYGVLKGVKLATGTWLGSETTSGHTGHMQPFTAYNEDGTWEVYLPTDDLRLAGSVQNSQDLWCWPTGTTYNPTTQHGSIK
jgi:hypothetical protein